MPPLTPPPLTPLPPSSHAFPVDSFPQAQELEAELRRQVRGEVRFDRGSRALYATDGGNYRHIPIGVVIPRGDEDVFATIAACRKYDAPILPRGTGTGLAGQTCNVAVVMDFTKYMNRILELDPERRIARVQPGVVLDTLRNAAEVHKLTFGPDPATHNRCSLGGMMGNNSCGTHSLMSGKTVDNVEEMRVLLYDGSEMTVGPASESHIEQIVDEGGRRGAIYAKLRAIRDQYGEAVRRRYPRIPRRVSGYNLDQLLPENGFHVARSLIGSEGTCVTILEAKLRLISSPQHRALVGLGYPDCYQAADHVPEILQLDPIGLEGFEGSMLKGLVLRGEPDVALLPQGGGYLLAEFGADDPREAEAIARRLIDRLGKLPGAPNMRVYTKAEARRVWNIRESGVRTVTFIPGAPLDWEGWDDSAVSPEKLGAYLRDLRTLLNEYGYHADFYGHFGHACIHMRVSFDLLSERGIRQFQEFMERAADLVIGYGGSLSGEHGDGQSRSALLPKMFGPELMQAFAEFKAAWDPQGKMNPRNIVNPAGVAAHLRLGADYKPLQPATHFSFAGDGGSLAKATLRCIGLGECRKDDAGTMCPSYRATREEEHSTRGRAHLLFEMLQGEAIRDGWQDEHVKHALDLCLSCKACKTECPASVDIATYRSEFLSHYYEGKRRPLYAYAFGMIDRWARYASLAPGLANFLGHAPILSGWVHKVLDLAPQRQIPRLADVNFRRWALGRHLPSSLADTSLAPRESGKRRDKPRVILWADTFNNYFHPQTSRAAFEVLEGAGFEVFIPREPLCCGRPLYDYGMLSTAEQYLRRILQTLGPAIDAGVPIVVLEPSCASVFRDELCGLLPQEARAARLREQTFLLAEFLEQQAPEFEPPQLSRHVLLHGHCHQKALMKMTAAETLLRKMGVELETLDSGCCGMAGAFGYEREKFAVSQAIGESVLLPAVRQASPETLIVSDGFSCREQILQATGKRALHLAELLQMAAQQSAVPTPLEAPAVHG